MGIICKETDSVPTCIICGVEYERKSTCQMTCGSKKCRNERAKRLKAEDVVDKVCEVCGRTYQATRLSYAKTCGPDCRRVKHVKSAEKNLDMRAEKMAKAEVDAFPDPFLTMKTHIYGVESWLSAEMMPLI